MTKPIINENLETSTPLVINFTGEVKKNPNAPQLKKNDNNTVVPYEFDFSCFNDLWNETSAACISLKKRICSSLKLGEGESKKTDVDLSQQKCVPQICDKENVENDIVLNFEKIADKADDLGKELINKKPATENSVEIENEYEFYLPISKKIWKITQQGNKASVVLKTIFCFGTVIVPLIGFLADVICGGKKDTSFSIRKREVKPIDCQNSDAAKKADLLFRKQPVSQTSSVGNDLETIKGNLFILAKKSKELLNKFSLSRSNDDFNNYCDAVLDFRQNLQALFKHKEMDKDEALEFFRILINHHASEIKKVCSYFEFDESKLFADEDTSINHVIKFGWRLYVSEDKSKTIQVPGLCDDYEDCGKFISSLIISKSKIEDVLTHLDFYDERSFASAKNNLNKSINEIYKKLNENKLINYTTKRDVQNYLKNFIIDEIKSRIDFSDCDDIDQLIIKKRNCIEIIRDLNLIKIDGLNEEQINDLIIKEFSIDEMISWQIVTIAKNFIDLSRNAFEKYDYDQALSDFKVIKSVIDYSFDNKLIDKNFSFLIIQVAISELNNSLKEKLIYWISFEKLKNSSDIFRDLSELTNELKSCHLISNPTLFQQEIFNICSEFKKTQSQNKASIAEKALKIELLKEGHEKILIQTKCDFVEKLEEDLLSNKKSIDELNKLFEKEKHFIDENKESILSEGKDGILDRSCKSFSKSVEEINKIKQKIENINKNTSAINFYKEMFNKNEKYSAGEDEIINAIHLDYEKRIGLCVVSFEKSINNINIIFDEIIKESDKKFNDLFLLFLNNLNVSSGDFNIQREVESEEDSNEDNDITIRELPGSFDQNIDKMDQFVSKAFFALPKPSVKTIRRKNGTEKQLNTDLNNLQINKKRRRDWTNSESIFIEETNLVN